MDFTSKEITAFRRAVLQWFAQHGRKHLPWQQNPTPYRVWISEIMLQQTQVTTVIPYFEKFMQHFPTVFDLAHAKEDEVLHLWSGLGYYSRARNLHQTAKKIVTDFAGEFPNSLTLVQTLPGIGRSTAGAILALSMQKRAAILDGNVKRVLARVHLINAWQSPDRLWQIAEAYTPKVKVAEYTQAMMDLGATVCIRSRPLCLICPLQKMCLAYRQQKQALFPGKKLNKTLPVRQVKLLILHDKHGKVLLQKRPATGIWGGLWSLPELTENLSVQQYCKTHYQIMIKRTITGEPFRHTFTHFHLDITPLEIHLNQRIDVSRLSHPHCWYDLRAPTPIGLAAPIKKLLLKTLLKT